MNSFAFDSSRSLPPVRNSFPLGCFVVENEKNKIAEIRALRESLELAKQSLQKAERDFDLENAAKLRHGVIPGIEQQIAEAEKALDETSGRRLLKEDVTDSDIAEIVARWTHIPVKKLVAGEKEKKKRRK